MMIRIFLALLCVLGFLSDAAEARRLCPILCGKTNTSGAAADLNFASGTSLGCSSFSSCLANTNSTGGYCTDGTGVLHQIAANTLRICSGAGLLTEESRANSMLQSQALGTAPWTIAPGTLTNNVLAAPDGTVTATSLTDTTATAVFQAGQVFLNTVLTGTNVVSVYLKAGSQSWGNIQVNVNGAVNASVAYFQLTGSGTLGSITPLVGSNAIISSSITALANGWYLCSVVTGNLTGPNSLFFGAASANNGRSYTGTGTVALYIWGGQTENNLTNAFGTSYIPTTTTAVTRSADNVAVSGVLATTLAGSTGSIVANANKSQQSLAGTLVDANGVVLIGKTLGNVGTTAVGATLSTANTGTWTGSNDLGLAWNVAGGALQLNGGTLATDATARTPSATFHVGSTGGSSAFFNGYFSRLTAYAIKQASPQ